ncbi:MAG: hypothetical protein D6751_08460 [Deltaproteobacteria bacterium]|nr:MAG: hypothetical protein D6751_08460 [Deltaproteobacteria bacterium]
MKKLRRFLLWSLVFLVLLAACDQVLVRLPAGDGALAVVQQFYVDFRSRLFGVITGEAPRSIEQVIEKAAKPPAAPAKGPSAVPAGPRYLYVDADGNLQFAESLQEIPAAFRSSAQKLQE